VFIRNLQEKNAEYLRQITQLKLIELDNKREFEAEKLIMKESAD
jgi:hypothetical protein